MKNIYYPSQTFLNRIKPLRRFDILRFSLFGMFLLATFLCVSRPVFAQSQFNTHEIKVIKEKIQMSFDLLINTWNEELYFEMYDLGQRQSRMKLSRVEFAQRMVELKWKSSLKPVKIEKIDIIYHNYAIIYFFQEFENKVNSLRLIEKKMIFPAILEDGSWKFDLTQLINIPYEGKFFEAAPSPPVEPTADSVTNGPAATPVETPPTP